MDSGLFEWQRQETGGDWENQVCVPCKKKAQGLWVVRQPAMMLVPRRVSGGAPSSSPLGSGLRGAENEGRRRISLLVRMAREHCARRSTDLISQTPPPLHGLCSMQRSPTLAGGSAHAGSHYRLPPSVGPSVLWQVCR